MFGHKLSNGCRCITQRPTAYDMSDGASNTAATNMRAPEAPVPRPPHDGTSEEELRGSIQMLIQLVAAQSCHQD
ncbi:hypothetical protein HAX54_024967 [Datura stramonium]|uniref:Uncharacterized protein n=1 Tax=Datura stramonium TaxID=4076 RepID=A0ABS8S7H1_DATST|nr:hypothetical protein [Datura stramonium]